MASSKEPDQVVRDISIDRLIEDRPLLPFLPLIYVAWADGELSTSERRSIQDQVTAQGGLDAGCRERLASWLDVNDPPSARELSAILRTIRRASQELPGDARISLAELGFRLVGSESPASSPEKQALEALEEALGVAGAEASRELSNQLRPAPPSEAVRPSFQVAVLQELLDEPYGEVRSRLRGVLSRDEFTYDWELDRSSYRSRITSWCRLLAKEGFGALSFPKAWGGGDDLGAFIAVFQTLAHHDTSLLVKFGVQFGLFGGAVLQLGTERHHREYLERIGSLELPGCFAMSETSHGSNVQELETVARYDPSSDEFVITTPTLGARKDWIGNAAVDGQMAAVFAQLRIGEDEFGVHSFLVPIRDQNGRLAPGVEIEDCGLKEGLNGVDNGKIWFADVRVPRANLLDRFASVSADGEYTSAIASPSKRFFTMLGTLVGGRVSVAAASLSSAQTALTVAVRYATRRRQFGAAGRPEVLLIDYLAHQRKLLPRVAGAYAIDFAHKELVRQFLNRHEDNARRIETFAAGLKAYASAFNVETIQICREACGGQGYLAHNRISQLREDTDVFTTFEGDNTVLMLLVAKARLTAYGHQFADLRLGGMVKILASRAATAVAELNPVTTRATGEDHLRNPAFLTAAFKYREDRLQASLAGRLRSRLEGGMDSFEAFNDCQDHALKLANAHVERVVAESALAVAAKQVDGELGSILERVATLFCLWRLERDRAWFLGKGYFESAKAKAIRDLVLAQCRALRPDAGALVDSFGIPDRILAAPIAVDSVDGFE